MQPVAILTGDIVTSSAVPPAQVDRLMHWLATALQHSEHALPIARTRFTRFRGDGWQAIIDPAPLYFRTVSHLLVGLRLFDIGIQTRVGIGIGRIDRPGTRDLADASGPAFTLSGRALDAMTGADRLAIAGAEPISWHRAALDTLAHFSARWSREQAEALERRLIAEDTPLHAIAANLNISRQALSARLAVAGEKPLLALIRAIEAAP